MRKLTIIASLLLVGFISKGQEIKTNGTIYINHPNIKVVNETVKAYLAKDNAANMKLYADTATFWVSGMEKQIPIKEAFKEWLTDFDYYSNINIKSVGYPDYLNYTDADQKIVQSWWQWSGTSKLTGKVVKIDYVAFDGFNSAGKIIYETLYGDFSKMVKD